MIVSLIITPYILYRSRVLLTQNLKFRPEISAPSRATLKSIFKHSRIQATTCPKISSSHCLTRRIYYPNSNRKSWILKESSHRFRRNLLWKLFRKIVVFKKSFVADFSSTTSLLTIFFSCKIPNFYQQFSTIVGPWSLLSTEATSSNFLLLLRVSWKSRQRGQNISISLLFVGNVLEHATTRGDES